MAMRARRVRTDDGANHLVRFLLLAQMINRLLALRGCKFTGFG